MYSGKKFRDVGGIEKNGEQKKNTMEPIQNRKSLRKIYGRTITNLISKIMIVSQEGVTKSCNRKKGEKQGKTKEKR